MAKAIGKGSKITLMVSYRSTNLATGLMLGPPKPSAIGIDHLLKETKHASSTWNGFLTKEVTSSALAKNIMVTFMTITNYGIKSKDIVFIFSF